MEDILSLFNGVPKILAFCAVGLAVEYFRPQEKNQPGSAIIFNFVWIVNFVVMSNLVMIYFGRAVPTIMEFIGGPLFTISFPDSILGGLGQFLLLMLFHDFCYYVFHRCQHTWSWFWAHHKLHHTEIHMNATTSFRHHWLENVYRIPFIFLPMALFNIEGSYAVLAWDAALVWAIFTHMNVHFSMGPLTNVFAGPQVHRIHHSALEEHKNRNFAAFFPIWDILFGSFHKPAKEEYPPCGMYDGETTDSIWQANVGVFREWYQLFRGRGGRNKPSLEAPRTDEP